MTATTNAGWYTDPTDGTTMRYWDGNAWTDHTSSPDSAASVRTRPSNTFWTVCAGAATVAIGSFMPWAEADAMLGKVSVGPSGGALFLLLALAAAAAWCALPMVNGQVTVGRRVGMVVCVALLAFFAVSNWNELRAIQDQNESVQAGTGLLLYSAGVVALVVATIRTLMGKTS